MAALPGNSGIRAHFREVIPARRLQAADISRPLLINLIIPQPGLASRRGQLFLDIFRRI